MSNPLRTWCKQRRGRCTALANHLEVPVPRVSEYIAEGTRALIPLEYCPYIEQFTEGAVTCEELRPDKREYFQLLREQAIGRSNGVVVVADIGHGAIESKAWPPPSQAANQPGAAVAGQGVAHG